MNVIVDLCVVPIGVGTSLAPYVAECQRVLVAAGLPHRMHAYGTNIEGDWDAVMAAVKACHEAVHAMGAPRVSTSMRVGTRVDKPTSIAGKIARVNDLLAP